jgi:hypothetical protein
VPACRVEASSTAAPTAVVAVGQLDSRVDALAPPQSGHHLRQALVHDLGRVVAELAEPDRERVVDQHLRLADRPHDRADGDAECDEAAEQRDQQLLVTGVQGLRGDLVGLRDGHIDQIVRDRRGQHLPSDRAHVQCARHRAAPWAGDDQRVLGRDEALPVGARGHCLVLLLHLRLQVRQHVGQVRVVGADQAHELQVVGAAEDTGGVRAGDDRSGP